MAKKERDHQPIIEDSFEDFIKEEPKEDFIVAERKKEEIKEQASLDLRFSQERTKWNSRIQEMSSKLKRVGEIQELLVEIYGERQRSLEYYHYLISLMNKINTTYRKQYAKKYDYYSFGSQKRFPNDTVKNNQILSEMEDILNKKEAISNHAKFMEGTTKTIDNLIFGIKYRIEIEQISRGK